MVMKLFSHIINLIFFFLVMSTKLIIFNVMKLFTKPTETGLMQLTLTHDFSQSSSITSHDTTPRDHEKVKNTVVRS